VCKSDPVTFATDQLGDYLVQVNANDLATTGTTPSWLLVTLLPPENAADEAMAQRLMGQIGDACRELGIALVGGHTEVPCGLDRPVAVPVTALSARVFESSPDTKRGKQWPTPPQGGRNRRESNPTDGDIPDGAG
jgi:hydrogenase expression/formation protein HypE